MKLRNAMILAVFFGVWTVIDTPFWLLKKLGMPVKEIGEK